MLALWLTTAAAALVPQAVCADWDAWNDRYQGGPEAVEQPICVPTEGGVPELLAAARTCLDSGASDPSAGTIAGLFGGADDVPRLASAAARGQRAALDALGFLDAPEATEALEWLACGLDGPPRRAALAALSVLPRPELKPFFEAHLSADYDEAQYGLARIGAFDSLVAWHRVPDVSHKMRSSSRPWGLALMLDGDPEGPGTQHLLETAEGGDTLALRRLIAARHPRARALVLARAADPDTDEMTLFSLASGVAAGEDELLAAVVRGLRRGHPMDREAAAESLALGRSPAWEAAWRDAVQSGLPTDMRVALLGPLSRSRGWDADARNLELVRDLASRDDSIGFAARSALYGRAPTEPDPWLLERARADREAGSWNHNLRVLLGEVVHEPTPGPPIGMFLPQPSEYSTALMDAVGQDPGLPLQELLRLGLDAERRTAVQAVFRSDTTRAAALSSVRGFYGRPDRGGGYRVNRDWDDDLHRQLLDRSFDAIDPEGYCGPLQGRPLLIDRVVEWARSSPADPVLQDRFLSSLFLLRPLPANVEELALELLAKASEEPPLVLDSLLVGRLADIAPRQVLALLHHLEGSHDYAFKVLARSPALSAAERASLGLGGPLNRGACWDPQWKRKDALFQRGNLIGVTEILADPEVEFCYAHVEAELRIRANAPGQVEALQRATPAGLITGGVARRIRDIEDAERRKALAAVYAERVLQEPEAVFWLSTAGLEIVPHMAWLRLAGTTTDPVLGVAAHALAGAQSVSPRATRMALRVADHPDPDVQWFALVVLARNGSSEALPRILLAREQGSLRRLDYLHLLALEGSLPALERAAGLLEPWGDEEVEFDAARAIRSAGGELYERYQEVVDSILSEAP